MVLDVYEIKEYILPQHKRMLNTYRRTCEIRDLLNIMDLRYIHDTFINDMT